MTSILSVIPRPVPLTLGGQSWRASEFRLSDLADLQAWIGGEIPDPFEGAALRLLRGPRDADWKQLLSVTIDAQEAYPPSLDDSAASALLASPPGVQLQISLSLRREHPDLTPAAVRRIYNAVTVAEYDRLSRVMWGLNAMALMVGLVDGPAPPSPPLDWAAAWHRYVTTAKGPAPAFADLTLTQFKAWMTRGKLTDGIEADRPDWWQVAMRRAAFWGGEG